MATKSTFLYALRMALAPQSQPQSPWTSVCIRFKDKATLGDVDTAARMIRLMRGVIKCEPVCNSKNPALQRTYYCQLSPTCEPFDVTHKICDVQVLKKEVVLSAQIVRCADRAVKNRIPYEQS